MLNPAPARALDAGLLASVDVLVPNRGELELLGGPGEPAAVARSLPGPGAVVVTLGGEGALVVDGDRVEQSPRTTSRSSTPPARATRSAVPGRRAGAWRALVEAATDAVRVASRSTVRRGALEAFPTADEIAALAYAAGERAPGPARRSWCRRG